MSLSTSTHEWAFDVSDKPWKKSRKKLKVGKKVGKKSREKVEKKNRENGTWWRREKSREKCPERYSKSKKNSGKKLKDKKKVEWGKIERKICMALAGLQEKEFSLFLFLYFFFCPEVFFPRWVFDFAVSSCLSLLLLLPWDILFLLWHFGSLTLDPNDNLVKRISLFTRIGRTIA